MKKFYATLLLALVAMTSFAQEQNDTTYVMMLFDANPWGYGVSEVTSGWSPDLKDLDAPGAILKDTDFSWPISEGSSTKVKVTVYAVDLDESERVPMLGRYELNAAEAAGYELEPGSRIILYTVPGTTMRFEAPDGYKFGKLLFYTFHSPNFLVGDDYDEAGPNYTYEGNTFTQTLKMWKPDSPKQNQYGSQMWEGDEKNIHFNYPYFNSHFVKIDIRLVPDGTASISDIRQASTASKAISLDGRTYDNASSLPKGIYIVDGKKYVVR